MRLSLEPTFTPTVRILGIFREATIGFLLYLQSPSLVVTLIQASNPNEF